MHGNRQKSGEDGHGAGPLLAVLDLGTNNCRLLIAAPVPARDGGTAGFRVVDSFSRIVRLGEGVSQTGLLSEAAMDRTIAALKVCADRIAKHQVAHVRAIATQAARLAAQHRHADPPRPRRNRVWTCEVISAEEEADLAAEGCAPLIGRRYSGALVFDIGGGSTEIIWLQKSPAGPQKKLAASVPVGVVSLAESYGAASTSRAGFDRMRADLTARFEPFAQADAATALRQPANIICWAPRAPSPRSPPSRSSCRATTAPGWMAAGTRPRICCGWWNGWWGWTPKPWPRSAVSGTNAPT